MIPNKLLKTVLIKQKLVTDEVKIEEIKKEAKKNKKHFLSFLLKGGFIDEKPLFSGIAKHLKLPFISLKDLDISQEILELVPSALSVSHHVIAYKKDEKEIYLAMVDPTDIETAEFIRRKIGLEPNISVVTPSDMRDILHLRHVGLDEEFKIIKEQSASISNIGDLKKVAEELPVVNIVNSILEHAVYDSASDIHIEPEEKDIKIRYRIDGVLRKVTTLPKILQSGIIARIKILANLKLDEHMIPQDGRFKIQVQDERTAFRVSIIPVFDGEKIVMRLLPEGVKSLTLDQLGFLDKAKDSMNAAIKKPNGMILVTGPTGSGKTTTLYSILSLLNKPGVNISTIEDPIEFRVAGINQSQINPKVGFTFASGLRAFLRQDPNIIMVGEIRDQETAEIAIHSAMTGHLVLSTLHTNDAPTTLPRLIDMGVPPFLVAYTVNIIVGQRLVRKICKYCKKEYKLNEIESKQLSRLFNTEKLIKLFKEVNVLKKGETSLKDLIFYKGDGCKKCGQSGYKGRLGIYEVMDIDDAIIKKINDQGTAGQIKELAQKNGMITMSEDGLIKAKLGITTVNEVFRVTKE